ATPASRPLVHTLVAKNSVSVTPRSAARSPATDSAVPYIGEESITRPPSSTNRCTSVLRGARSGGAGPTSNVRQVPRPTAGIASPLDGMGRVRIDEAARAGEGPAAAAALRPRDGRRVRGSPDHYIAT